MSGPLPSLSAAALSLVMLALASAAAAQPEDPEDPRARSREHFMAGVAHLQAERHAEAVDELEAARALYPTAPIHFNLGLAYRAVGRVRDAIAAFESFERAAGDTMTPERREEVDRYLRSLRASLAVLRIVASPEEATISLDGEPVGRGRVRLELDPGRYQLRIAADGYAEAEREITVAPGSHETVRVPLSRSLDLGTLALDVTPEETSVSVDGRLRGVGDMELELPAGPHQLLLEAGEVRREQAFEITAGERLSLALGVAAGGTDLTWLWVTLGILVAGGAAATVAYFVLNPSDQAPLPGNLGVVMTALEGR